MNDYVTKTFINVQYSLKNKLDNFRNRTFNISHDLTPFSIFLRNKNFTKTLFENFKSFSKETDSITICLTLLNVKKDIRTIHGRKVSWSADHEIHKTLFLLHQKKKMKTQKTEGIPEQLAQQLILQ